jgi:hypothetical protein
MKTLLRQNYGVMSFFVSEPSEDSDGVFGALFGGIMESVADWYRQNLAAEVAKGKSEPGKDCTIIDHPSTGKKA